MKFWIHHPAVDDQPVGLLRWLKWHASQWLLHLGDCWERDALHPGWREDDIPF